MNEGYIIWEIQKNGVPKEIKSGTLEFLLELKKLDLINKTYAIRIGKEGLK